MYVDFYKNFGIFMNIIDKSKVTDIFIISSESWTMIILCDYPVSLLRKCNTDWMTDKMIPIFWQKHKDKYKYIQYMKRTGVTGDAVLLGAVGLHI